MLDIKFIRENPEAVKQNILNKNESSDISSILDLDEKRRKIIQDVEKLKNQRNIVTNEIALLKRNKEDASEKIQEMKEVSDSIKNFDEELGIIEEKLKNELLRVPNMVDSSVPIGKTAEDNKIIRYWGTPKESCPMNHIEIAKKFGILDFERGAKVSGSGFAYYVGQGAALERAIINFMIDFHVENHGYKEILSPFIVNTASMVGTGQIPKFPEDMYYVESDNLYLIPTAEVPLTNFHAGDVLKGEDLPIKFCGYSPCFRREAGSYGKETRGFLRVHQFNKVEMVKFAFPENSYDELESLTKNAEAILQALELPYRTILLCSGDTSFSSSKTYDLEVWSPAEQKWLEVSSCSNFEDFQARRANIRFKRTPNDKPEFVHTLNGSGVATSRLMVALLENYFDGERIKIPDALINYYKKEFID